MSATQKKITDAFGTVKSGTTAAEAAKLAAVDKSLDEIMEESSEPKSSQSQGKTAHDVSMEDPADYASDDELVGTRPLFQGSGLSEEQQETLRQFDLNPRFGPCAGLSRMERYERARDLGLNPPLAAGQLLESPNASGRDNGSVWSQYNL